MNMNGFRNITVAELRAMMEKGGLRLVDVRTDAEISRGKIRKGIRFRCICCRCAWAGWTGIALRSSIARWVGVPPRRRPLPRPTALTRCITCRAVLLRGRRRVCRLRDDLRCRYEYARADISAVLTACKKIALANEQPAATRNSRDRQRYAAINGPGRRSRYLPALPLYFTGPVFRVGIATGPAPP